MANPTLVHPEKRDDRSGITIDAGGFAVDGKQLVKAQEATIADAAAATAAAAALTGAANAAVTGVTLDTSNLVDGSANNVMLDLNSTFNQAEVEENQDKMCDEIEANRVDIALILAQADKSTVDIAAQKVELDKLITDRAANLTTINAILTALENHGLLADA